MRAADRYAQQEAARRGAKRRRTLVVELQFRGKPMSYHIEGTGLHKTITREEAQAYKEKGITYEIREIGG